MKKLKLKALEIGASEVLTKAELKKIIGGNGGGSGSSNSCNAYCGQGSGYTCTTVCQICDDAGGGSNPNVPGGDKLCVAN